MTRNPAVVCAAVLALLALATSTQASPRAGEQAFQKGDFSKAEQEYRKAATKNPDKPVLQFNHGSAAYKASQFDAAAQSFSKAMKTDDLKLRQDDYYNLGNTEYRLGQKTEKTNPEETRKTWEKAVGSYEAALKLKPEDTDAKYNRDLVKRKLEELKKQQKEQQQQNQQKSQQDNQSKSDDKQNQPNQDQNKSDNKKAQQNKQSGGSGQQDKEKPDQNNPDQQQAKDQTKPEDKKDQEPKQNASGGQPEKQDQPNQKSEEKNHAAQPDQKPEQTKKDGQAQARNPQPNEESRKDQSDAQPEPGRMSREEARQLLDSLKSGDRKMPLTPYARGNGSAREEGPLKDW